MAQDQLTPTGGTALIVVPGVGDDAPGDTVGSMTTALLKELGGGAGSIPFRRSIVVPSRATPGDEPDRPEVHELHCAAVTSPSLAAPLVVYEMHWADLSRFPGTLRRFVLTLYGMLFQVATIGIEAYRAVGFRAWQRRALRAFSYVTTVWIVGLTAGAALLGVEFAAMVKADARTPQVLIAIATALVAGGLAWFGDAFLRRNGWRFTDIPLGLGRPRWAFLAIAGGIVAGPLAVHVLSDPERSLPLSVHDVLWQWVRWVLPVAWCVVAGLAIALSATLFMRADPGAERDRGFRAHRTAVISVVVGGLGIAVLGALLVAGALAVTAAVTGNGTHVPQAAATAVGTPQDPTFGPYSTEVFAYSLRPLGVALACSLALLAIIVVVGFRYVSALAQAGATSPPIAEGPSVLVLAALLVAAGLATLALGDSAGADVLSVVLTTAGIGLLVGGWWANRFGPDPARQPMRRGFDLLLRYLGGLLHVLAMVVALVVASVALLADTPLTSRLGEALGEFTNWLFSPFTRLANDSDFASYAQVSASVVVLIAIAAAVKARISLFGKALDVAYDVATYMRVPHGSPAEHDAVEPPRRKVLRRYAALLTHVQEAQQPDKIVIAAHSQGSIYTLALVFRDEFRDEADLQNRKGWTLAPSFAPPAERFRPLGVPESLLAIDRPVHLLTAGCPILQTYEPNFPGQYLWPSDPAAITRVLDRTRVAGWRNVYRSGDYFGRALWSGTCDPETTLRRLSERCIGPGQHTGYWGDPRFAQEVLDLI